MRPIFISSMWLLFSVAGQAQLVSFGVQGGVPAETPLGSPVSQVPFAFGPTVDVRLTSRLSVEGGVLFHRMGTKDNTGVFQSSVSSVTVILNSQRGRAIEVPLLAKFYLLGESRVWRPFVTGGVAVRRTSLHTNAQASILSGPNVAGIPSGSSLRSDSVQWNADPTFGAGVDLKAGRFHLEPQARYSYWGAGWNTTVRKNQVDLLLGFRF